MRRILLTGMLAVVLAGCGGSPAPTTAPPTRMPTPRATATPTPAPDVQRIDVLATGVGTWQLVAVPVAVLHNAATRSIATGVFVHLTPTRGGRPLTPLLTPAVTLYPGQTLVVAANCTDTCIGADGASATVTPGTWAVQPGTPLTAIKGTVTCTVSCQGHGQWDVPVTVGSPALVQNEQVDLFASCANAAGSIIGGGQRSLLWPQAGGTLDLDVAVILNAPPASCQVGATTSN
jgi:hypothetical protein